MTEPRKRPAVLLLGVDGGGTSTTAWLADADLATLGRGVAGPSNAKAVGTDAARRALGDVIRAAYADAGLEPSPADVACLGLAGFDRPEDRQLLAAWSTEAGWARRLELVNDGDLVVAAGTTEGWGVGVIAGTGSIAVGRDAAGRKARAGGWGYLVGDEGSAYAVVLEALRLVLRRFDGRDPQPDGGERLDQELCSALGVEGPARIVSALYAPGMDRTRIAALAPVVLGAADHDAELQAQVLHAAGESLAELIVAVARSLGFGAGPLPLALAGGFLLSATPVEEALLAAVKRAGFEPRAVRVPDPVRGAVVLAGRALSTPA